MARHAPRFTEQRIREALQQTHGRQFAAAHILGCNRKTIEREYALVHFDGPHDLASLAAEVAFFAPRTPPGGAWVFDDIQSYDHGTLHEHHILPAGMEMVASEGRKALYRRAG